MNYGYFFDPEEESVSDLVSFFAPVVFDSVAFSLEDLLVELSADGLGASVDPSCLLPALA